MQIAIIGLPYSGKTTIFNAATRGAASVGGYSDRANVGVAKVPDARLAALAEIYRPRKVTPAEITYLDIPAAPAGLGGSAGISGEYLNRLQTADAVAVVARAFEDPSVPDGGDGVDAARDLETMLYELAFADLAILERGLERIERDSKGAKGGDRDWEKDLLAKLRDGLESGIAIRDQSLTNSEAARAAEFQFLTAKPTIAVINAGESRMDAADDVRASIEESVDALAGVRSAILFGGLEMELAQMPAADEAEFRESLGAGESGLERMVRLSYGALDRITFFTGGPKEVRAWTVARGDSAPRAAGRIHSDMERGFIRAEVVGFDDLTACGSETEARKRGLMRQEGKSYTVSDGDVMHILFNV